MKRFRLLLMSLVLAFLVLCVQNARAQFFQPVAPSFTGLKDWIKGQRPQEKPFDFELPAYPDWYGSCPNTADLMTGFGREFNRECVAEIYTSNIKSIGQSLEATRTFPDEVRNVISLCLEKMDTKNLSPEKMAKKLKQCTDAAKDIKEKADGVLEQGSDLSAVSSKEELASFVGMAEGLAMSLSTCTLKAMFTSGNMTERQKKDVKQEIDSFIGVLLVLPAGLNVASHVSQMAVTIAENGLEHFQTENINDLEDVLIGLDKLSVADVAKKQADEFLKSMRSGVWGRNLTLEEKGQEISLLMNSCQVNEALDDLEIYQNMVKQEFLEQRWAITKDEKNLWCAAQARGYDKMNTEDEKWAFLTGSTDGLTPNSPDFAKHFNRERDWWRRDLKNHKDLIEKISNVYEEFSHDKIESARQEEQRERALIEQLTERTFSLVDNQCRDVNTDSYLQDLDMTGRRLVRARDSNCGQAGLAAEYKLDMLVRILDIMKKQTDSQLKIRQETVAEINNLLSFCKTSEAQKALEDARGKMEEMKSDRQRIDQALANQKTGDTPSVIWAPGNVEIEGFDRCYASTFSMLERQIADEQDITEGFLKKIDADIQPARRALENCEGPSVLSGLRETRAQLAAKQCNSAPGISVRLREIDILEKALDPKNCSGQGKAGCSITPMTAPADPGKYYQISATFWGSDGAAHCLTSAEAAAMNAKSDTTASLIGDGGSCPKCPAGFDLKQENGSAICVKCPEGKRYSNGCCL